MWLTNYLLLARFDAPFPFERERLEWQSLQIVNQQSCPQSHCRLKLPAQRKSLQVLANSRPLCHKTLNKQKGSNFDPIANVITQIPFFGCYNHIREPKYLKLVNKYVYCTETGTPAHTGGYGDQPATWVEYFFIIKNALAKKEKQMHDKMNREAKING